MESERTPIENTPREGTHSFGEKLYLAREKKGIVIEEVSSSTHLQADIIEALERSDIGFLPEPIYVQGYIKAYAKFLGIPAQDILDAYNRAVPHASEYKLTPPPLITTSRVLNSNAPAVWGVSIILIVLLVMAGIYGIVSYYSRVAETIENEQFAADMVKSTELEGAELAEDNILDNENALVSESSDTQSTSGINDNVSKDVSNEKVITEKVLEERVMGVDTERAALIQTQPVSEGDDELTIKARKASWVEVVDANRVKLHYNLVIENKVITLKGTAPFDVFLGNAPVVDIKINNIDVGIGKFIRSNNIAHFKVSADDGQVQFH